jgi:Effector protein
MTYNIQNINTTKQSASNLVEITPEQKDFENYVSKIPDIPRMPDRYGFIPQRTNYSSIKNILNDRLPVLRYGRLLFVVSKYSNSPIDIKKIKSDITAALKKMASIPTGVKILSTAKDKGLPVLVNISADPNPDEIESGFIPAENITKNKEVDNFKANYDTIHWSPYAGYTFKNPNGSLAKMPPWIVLFHELSHGKYLNDDRNDSIRNSTSPSHITSGIGKKSIFNGMKNDPEGVMNEEKRNLPFEQKALREAGLIPRMKYKLKFVTSIVKSPLNIP